MATQMVPISQLNLMTRELACECVRAAFEDDDKEAIDIVSYSMHKSLDSLCEHVGTFLDDHQPTLQHGVAVPRSAELSTLYGCLEDKVIEISKSFHPFDGTGMWSNKVLMTRALGDYLWWTVYSPDPK